MRTNEYKGGKTENIYSVNHTRYDCPEQPGYRGAFLSHDLYQGEADSSVPVGRTAPPLSGGCRAAGPETEIISWALLLFIIFFFIIKTYLYTN